MTFFPWKALNLYFYFLSPWGFHQCEATMPICQLNYGAYEILCDPVKPHDVLIYLAFLNFKLKNHNECTHNISAPAVQPIGLSLVIVTSMTARGAGR